MPLDQVLLVPDSDDPLGPRSWVVPAMFSEVEVCVECHMTWAEWLAQPKEHRALMLAYHRVKGRMTAVESQESRQRSELHRLARS